MASIILPTDEPQAYCIFSQKTQCPGFPDDPDHPACNCIYAFINRLDTKNKKRHAITPADY
jgi:hypothetical protein